MMMKINRFNPEWGLEAYAFISTQQLIVFEDCVSFKIITSGSGFLLKYKDRLFFVTADHIVHHYDFFENETGQRARVEYCSQIITNVRDKDSLRSKNIQLGGFFDYTEYILDKETISAPKELNALLNKIANQDIDINDESLSIDIRIPTFIDIAICEMKYPLEEFILTPEVSFPNGYVLIPANVSKEPLPADVISDFNTEDSYLVAGNICRGVKNSVWLEYLYMHHIDMKFERFDSSGNAILKVQEEPNIDNWYGLSGSPVFNYNKELVGMLVNGPEKEPLATVVPIKTIIEYIDRCIAYESN